LAVIFNQIREETKLCPSKNAAKVVLRRLCEPAWAKEYCRKKK
jgi:hypothetical protein